MTRRVGRGRTTLALTIFAGVAAYRGGPVAAVSNDAVCYALSFGTWSSPPDNWEPLPALVQLDESRDHPWRRWMPEDTATHVARSWAEDGTPSLAFDIWRRQGRDSIAVTPFLRPGGYVLVLPVREGTLSGVVTFHTDFYWPEKPPDPRADVTARPTPCPEASLWWQAHEETTKNTRRRKSVRPAFSGADIQ